MWDSMNGYIIIFAMVMLLSVFGPYGIILMPMCIYYFRFFSIFDGLRLGFLGGAKDGKHRIFQWGCHSESRHCEDQRYVV
jgi:hypothetical protein